MRRTALALVLLLAACGGDGGDGGTGGGAPARTIEVKALGTLKFDPATITAKAGEKVTFRVTNTDAQDHEFVIGDAAYQAGHETAAGHGGHADGDGGGAVTVKPGETKTLDYTFPDKAPTYACHLNSHDDAGMTGTVTY